MFNNSLVVCLSELFTTSLKKLLSLECEQKSVGRKRRIWQLWQARPCWSLIYLFNVLSKATCTRSGTSHTCNPFINFLLSFSQCYSKAVYFYFWGIIVWDECDLEEFIWHDKVGEWIGELKPFKGVLAVYRNRRQSEKKAETISEFSGFRNRMNKEQV